VLHTCVLGLALAGFRVWPGASTLLPALADSPQQRAAVCRLYRGIRRLLLLPHLYDASAGSGDGGDGGGGGGGGTCPPSAPALVVFWIQLVDVLAPLAVAYAIELRARGAFLRARGLRPSIGARSVAAGMAAALVSATHVVWLAGPYLT
jgi:hypothetical protein